MNRAQSPTRFSHRKPRRQNDSFSSRRKRHIRQNRNHRLDLRQSALRTPRTRQPDPDRRLSALPREIPVPVSRVLIRKMKKNYSGYLIFVSRMIY